MDMGEASRETLGIARRVLVYYTAYPEWLNAASEQLAVAGYSVRKTASRDEARDILKRHLIHVALVDVDRDGLEVINHIRTAYPECRVVIFTANADEQAGDVISCLTVPNQRAHACFDQTRAEVESLVDYVKAVFKEHVRISEGLRVNLCRRDIAMYHDVMTKKAGGRRPDLRNVDIGLVEEELLSVLGKLFCKHEDIQQLNLDLLKEPKGFTAVMSVVPETSAGRAPKDVVLKFGPVDVIETESRNFDRYVLWYKRMTQTVVKLDFARMNKFAGLLYAFAGDCPHNIMTFASVIQNGSSDEVCRYVRQFFNPQTKDWYREPRMGRGIRRYYETVLQSKTVKDMEDTIIELTKSNQSRLRKDGEGRSFTIFFEDLNKRYVGPQRLYFNPITVPIRECIVHGDLHSNNIVLAEVGDRGQRAWYLLDYFHTGPGHVFKDFVDLEISVRYDLFWSRSLPEGQQIQLRDIFKMEEGLLRSSLFTGDPELQPRDDDAHDPVSKASRIIAEIRRMARENFGVEVEPESHYWLALFYSSLRMLLYTYPTRVKRHYLLLSCLLLQTPLDHFISRAGTSPDTEVQA